MNPMTTTTTKYPNITVHLIGEDGNAYAILGRVADALERNGHADEVEAFLAEAKSGDYDNLLRTVMQWVHVPLDSDISDEEEAFYERYPDGCYDCDEKYAVGGCPNCGDEC